MQSEAFDPPVSTAAVDPSPQGNCSAQGIEQMRFSHCVETAHPSLEAELQKARSCICVCICMFTTRSCLALCDPMDCNPPGSSVHGLFQARILERVALSFSRGSSQHRDRTCVASPTLAGRFFTTKPPGTPLSLYFLDEFFGPQVSVILQACSLKVQVRKARK